MHPYHAQHLAQARIDHLLLHRQARLPRDEREAPRRRERLQLLLTRWLAEPSTKNQASPVLVAAPPRSGDR